MTKTRTTSQLPSLLKIQAARVRYIKLGTAGMWEEECISTGIIRFGFQSANTERFPLCRAGRWKDLMESFIREGLAKGVATNFTNQTRLFFEADGSTLWITFYKNAMYWGFLDPAPPEPHRDGDGVWRRVSGGWKFTDVLGEKLITDRLSGALTQLAAFRGTSCDVDVSDYVVRRINGQKTPELERAVAAVKQMRLSALELIKLLQPREFETLVDLVFSTSGWRRQGEVGRTQKTLDLDLLLPSTGERAFVQIKSNTTSAVLVDYVAQLEGNSLYEKMFFVYHSGEASTTDERVTVIGPERLAEMVVDAGLVDWLIRKAS